MVPEPSERRSWSCSQRGKGLAPCGLVRTATQWLTGSAALRRHSAVRRPPRTCGAVAAAVNHPERVGGHRSGRAARCTRCCFGWVTDLLALAAGGAAARTGNRDKRANAAQRAHLRAPDASLTGNGSSAPRVRFVARRGGVRRRAAVLVPDESRMQINQARGRRPRSDLPVHTWVRR
eukprot:361539-Chlamydomonas_euryale.AAC.3